MVCNLSGMTAAITYIYFHFIRSGSMAGQKLSILKLAALSLLDTLQENDYVNIVAVVSNINWLDEVNNIDK